MSLRISYAVMPLLAPKNTFPLVEKLFISCLYGKVEPKVYYIKV